MKTKVEIVYLNKVITSQTIDECVNPDDFQIRFSNGNDIIWGTVKDLILDD
jgi:hypothetical protein